MRASQAVRLLGTRVVLTGIQPQIAQTLVQQEVDLSGITTHGTLQAGIATVLQQ
jgi:rsbT co-antagonist protein RsbR